jgi:hypothetical protein
LLPGFESALVHALQVGFVAVEELELVVDAESREGVRGAVVRGGFRRRTL